MANSQINLDDFPNSAYAQELRRSAWDMRFRGSLEAEYTAAYVERIRLRARVWFSLSVLLTAFFSIQRMGSVSFRDAQLLTDCALLFPCVCVLAWLTWSRHFGRWYLPTARILAPVYFIVIAALIPFGIAHGDNQLATLTVNVLAVFFFSGLMFRESMLATILMVAAFAATALTIHLAAAPFTQSMVVLILTVLVGTIVHRDVEKSYRNSFLEGALIGELAARDGLTGVMNRRTFDEHLLRVWQHAMRARQSIALLMIDIDHFKEYNDNFGHQAGDAALRTVAQSLQEFARRPLDLAARFGGEEFAVVLFDLALEPVCDIAERIRQRVQELQIVRSGADATYASITVSIGVSLAAPTLGRTPQGAVQLADEALYEAKRDGRNRVVVKSIEAYRLLETGAFKARIAV